MLQTDPKEALKSIYMIQNFICATDRPKEAVKSIYTIQNSVCAKDRPDRGIYMIYNFVHARDRFIICKDHIHED